MSGMASYTPGMEITGGSLGHGLGIAVGMALRREAQEEPAFIYNLMSDGELGEGSTWEAAMSGAHHKLDNLICLIDFNNQQADGKSTETLSAEPSPRNGTLSAGMRSAWTATIRTRVVDAFDAARAFTTRSRGRSYSTPHVQGRALPRDPRNHPFRPRRGRRMAQGTGSPRREEEEENQHDPCIHGPQARAPWPPPRRRGRDLGDDRLAGGRGLRDGPAPFGHALVELAKGTSGSSGCPPTSRRTPTCISSRTRCPSGSTRWAWPSSC